jgi:hypothetical protein
VSFVGLPDTSLPQDGPVCPWADVISEFSRDDSDAPFRITEDPMVAGVSGVAPARFFKPLDQVANFNGHRLARY